MKPSVGRIVHACVETGVWAPAIVNAVHNETCVSVTAFPFGEYPTPHTSLVQASDADGSPEPGTWRWPPRV